MATIPQILALADAVPDRYRAFILTATWSSAPWGELVALTRDRLDLLHGTMRIDRQLVELRDCRLEADSPKSEAGVRTIHLPPHLIPELEHHLANYVPPGCLYVFPNSKGEPIKRSSFRSVWLLARTKAGLPNLRFHDLRHTGNTLAAATGASTRELMARMGHSSMRAALIYQHATQDRDAAIAAALSDLAGSHPSSPHAKRLATG
jgi:integrase